MNQILITAYLCGLRVLTQLIVLSFYKTELLEILTFSHVTLTLVLYSEKVLFLFLNKVNLENTLFANKFISNVLPSLFNDWFLFSSDQHNYETFWSYHGNLHKPSYKTNMYGKNSVVVSAVNSWNNSQKFLQIFLTNLSPNKIKKILK